MIELKDRILLNNGMSIVDDDTIIKYLLDDGVIPDCVKAVVSDESLRFEKKYQTKITYEIEDVDLKPETSFDEDKFEDIVLKLYNNQPSDISETDHQNRFESEMRYFIDNNHQRTLIVLNDLVEKFREDGVVWGVGRGSSVASYILFLLGIHDINPIKYNISPREFYKSFGD